MLRGWVVGAVPSFVVVTKLNASTGATTELLRLPGNQPCGSPGLVYENDVLWVSYYSTHEKTTGVYPAKASIK